MSAWYYVDENRERIGPVEESELLSLISSQVLGPESYIWKKGFDDWKKLEDIQELKKEAQPKQSPSSVETPVQREFEWTKISHGQRVFHIKVGIDRGGNETEYGPYSLDELKKAFNEKRINGKTLIFTSGMETWMFLAEIPIFQSVFERLPPVIEEIDRRSNIRKPFVARMFFHDNREVFEGICRDISVGGLQILVPDAPVSIGDKITMNVHPENSTYNFVATGEVVRILGAGQGFSLRFLNLNGSAQEAINKYVTQPS